MASVAVAWVDQMTKPSTFADIKTLPEIIGRAVMTFIHKVQITVNSPAFSTVPISTVAKCLAANPPNPS